MKTRRLTKKEMRIFAVGQLGWSILSGLINAWLVTFYLPTTQDVEKGAHFYLPTGLIIFGILTILGLIAFICRIFDAVTDPWIASLSDRSTNPKGRRIPFMKRAAVPFAVIAVLVFFAPVNGVSGVNIAWVLCTLILFYLFMTMYCTPYNALISEFGKTQEDRMYISTAISLTFFFGTLIAYLPFVFAGVLQGMAVSFAWSYRACFIVLAIVALVCMLIPVFKLNEKEFVDAVPSDSNAIKSLAKTFQNKEFVKFAASDIAYWIGLTLFQTGLPFFVKVSMELDASWAMYLLGGMTVLSACFYPIVSKLVSKFGKKKLVITGFLGLALGHHLRLPHGAPRHHPPGHRGRRCGAGRHRHRREAGGHVLRRPDLRHEDGPVRGHAGVHLVGGPGHHPGFEEQRPHRVPHRASDRGHRGHLLLRAGRRDPRCLRREEGHEDHQRQRRQVRGKLWTRAA